MLNERSLLHPQKKYLLYKSICRELLKCKLTYNQRKQITGLPGDEADPEQHEFELSWPT